MPDSPQPGTRGGLQNLKTTTGRKIMDEVTSEYTSAHDTGSKASIDRRIDNLTTLKTALMKEIQHTELGATAWATFDNALRDTNARLDRWRSARRRIDEREIEPLIEALARIDSVPGLLADRRQLATELHAQGVRMVKR